MNLHVAWKILICAGVFIVSAGIVQAEENYHARIGLGQAYVLEKTDILDGLGPGVDIYKPIDPACFDEVDHEASEKDIFYYEQISDLAEYIRGQANLSGSKKDITGRTIAGTLNAVYSGAKYTTAKITGVSLDVISYTRMHTLNPNCMTTDQLDEQFKKDFAELPVVVTDPHVATSWEPYRTFINRYGSHVMTAVYIGSRLQQWSLAKSSSNYNYSNFAARACAQVEGPSGSGYSAQGCAGYTQEQKQKSLSFDMQTKLYVLGGTQETRAQLLNHRTPELLEKFVQEADIADQPIRRGFKPIAEIMSYASGIKGYKNIAQNMDAYYRGFYGFGCLPSVAPHTEVYLQKFVNVSSGGLPSFACQIAAEGCHAEKTDCHIGGAIASECYCYGPSCIIRGHSSTGRLMSIAQKDKNHSGTNEGVNQSCYYTIGAKCECNTKWGATANIWLQSER